MFTNRIRPRYLEHELAEVIEVDDRTVTVRLWRPVGRFGDRELRCPPLALRKTRPRNLDPAQLTARRTPKGIDESARGRHAWWSLQSSSAAVVAASGVTRACISTTPARQRLLGRGVQHGARSQPPDPAASAVVTQRALWHSCFRRRRACLRFGDIWIARLESGDRRRGRSDSPIKKTAVVVARQRLPARLHRYAAGLASRGAGRASDHWRHAGGRGEEPALLDVSGRDSELISSQVAALLAERVTAERGDHFSDSGSSDAGATPYFWNPLEGRARAGRGFGLVAYACAQSTVSRADA
jgi:hypothetical protein